jgi:hAT family C-terminal dimerisation region
MARDYLAIPGASVTVERVFSGGRDILGIRRYSLGPETFRVLMILKHFLKDNMEKYLDDTVFDM